MRAQLLTSATAARLRLALVMQREGALMMRENLRRRHPAATESELDALFETWLLARPADAPGRRVPGQEENDARRGRR